MVCTSHQLAGDALSLLLVVPGLQSPRPSRSKVSILFPQGSDSKYFRLCWALAHLPHTLHRPVVVAGVHLFESVKTLLNLQAIQKQFID